MGKEELLHTHLFYTHACYSLTTARLASGSAPSYASTSHATSFLTQHPSPPPPPPLLAECPGTEILAKVEDQTSNDL